ncbi:hypothetical protein INS04_21955 (plasmid) [Enterobacter asburiae]|uniref:hypothetical protein n=1 Tax=Enterobacter asburiae TaxID=61645 RepID=UPI0018805517|nr:hypothetical protein [Enterobacter asburiae]QOV81176.1 hypothetical protein INS04_21955 [Enterobacter asburiae]
MTDNIGNILTATDAAANDVDVAVATVVTQTAPQPNAGQAVNFLASAKRHIKDGDFLSEHGCTENAGQLYGFVAECGLKALFILLGNFPTDSDGNPLRSKNLPRLKSHVDDIVPIVNSIDLYCQGRTAHYLGLLPNINNFLDWSVDHRYYDSASIPQSLARWKTGADEITNMLQQANLDGVL